MIVFKKYCWLISLVLFATASRSQTPTPASSPNSPRQTQTQPNAQFNLSDYGVTVKLDPRLIVVMAALDAAGFDPTPAGKEPSAFRALVRKDQVNLDPNLRERMKNYVQRNRLPAPATPADEAARYVSLAYVLGPPPVLDIPDRADDLPGGALEVLDFAPLVREFYKKSGIEERIAAYLHAYQVEGDRLRQPVSDMVRSVLSYLHTRPMILTTERVRVKSPEKKKSSALVYATREHERRFFIVPDLMAAPDTINFRVIADDYYAIIPEGTDPSSSEMRRAFLQYVIDPLVQKFNKEIATHRDQIKNLIETRTSEGVTVSPDVFLTVSRSLVAAADAGFEEATRLSQVTAIQRQRLQQARDDAARKAIATEAEAARAAIADEAVARLADDYEQGAVLDFFFAEQLHDIQASGFDIANFFPDLLTNLEPAREGKRLAQISTTRDRAMAARRAHPHYSVWLIDPGAEAREAANDTRVTALLTKLREVEKLLQVRHYEEAEAQLKALLQEYPGEARLLFAMGQTATLWARDTTDDDLQAERLNRALANYRLAIAAAPPDDRAMRLRAHEAMGRVLAFLGRNNEALKEFDDAIRIGPVDKTAYSNAVEGKRKLMQPN